MAQKKADAAKAVAAASSRNIAVEHEMTDVRKAAEVALVSNLTEKTFKSGKRGYYAHGKVTIDGVRYQGQLMLTEITKKN